MTTEAAAGEQGDEPVTGQVDLVDGRTAGYADHGPADGRPVLWCHGGPGSRLEPAALAPEVRPSGIRIIGIDRPGYGLSTPAPGREIVDWVDDALAVADHLGVDRFATVGVSTGGAYALALAAEVPERVSSVIACCALTDMRWEEGRAMMAGPEIGGIWRAADRDEALALAAEQFGEDGSKMADAAAGDDAPPLCPADLALFADPAYLAGMLAGFPAMFAFGVQGYADDRIADGHGWTTFDVATITCPVVVLHGGSDTIVPVAHAHHTAEIVPGASLIIHESLGHFSIVAEIVPLLIDLVG